MPEKRELDEGLNLDRVKVYLLDNEGTVTQKSSVQEKLCDYVKEHLEAYLDSHFEDEQCEADIKALREQCEEDKEEEGFVQIEGEDKEKDEVIKSVVSNVQWLLGLQRGTCPALQTLQEHVCEEAYAAGDIKGEVFEDVPESLKKWVDSERKVYVYSSGNSSTEKLNIENLKKSDLKELISGYFGKPSGEIARSESYAKIAEEVDVKPEEILLLTHAAKEAHAAKSAGLQVAVVTRHGNKELDKDEVAWDTFSSFSEVHPESAKKEKV